MKRFFIAMALVVAGFLGGCAAWRAAVSTVHDSPIQPGTTLTFSGKKYVSHGVRLDISSAAPSYRIVKGGAVLFKEGQLTAKVVLPHEPKGSTKWIFIVVQVLPDQIVAQSGIKSIRTGKTVKMVRTGPLGPVHVMWVYGEAKREIKRLPRTY